jgi:transcriptional regulator with XRE-family HTH domain
MTDGSPVLSRDTLWQDYFANLKTALASMREAFRIRANNEGLTQDDMAKALNINKSLVSRRLNGDENFTLKTLSFMATAMRCRLQIRFRPYEVLGHGDNFDNASDDETELRAINEGLPSPKQQQPMGIPN